MFLQLKAFFFSDLVYPRCTKGSETDCGSTAWAFSLFIVWNILSMVCVRSAFRLLYLMDSFFQYIFANMFSRKTVSLSFSLVYPFNSNIHVGEVVENFAYVFQVSSSGTTSISREQMRSFKKIWAQYSNPKTQYLERSQFAKFFSVSLQKNYKTIVDERMRPQKLSGEFEVRIHPAQYKISNIVEICKQPPGEDDLRPRVVDGLDLNKLQRILDGIDYAEIRKRRAVYIRLYYEAILTHEYGHGMSFTDMLTLLAHHKLIVDSEALV